MKKIFWLTSLALACCCVVRAQQGHDTPDSAAEPQPVPGESGVSVVANFSTVVRELNKVCLPWETDSAKDGDYFVIERGTDGSHYETIGALRVDGASRKDASQIDALRVNASRVGGNKTRYELTDMAPP